MKAVRRQPKDRDRATANSPDNWPRGLSGAKTRGQKSGGRGSVPVFEVRAHLPVGAGELASERRMASGTREKATWSAPGSSTFTCIQ